MSRTTRLSSSLLRTAAVAGVAALTLTACGSGSGSDSAGSGSGEVKVGLITKTDTNPFFVKMKEGAEKAAKSEGVELMTAAGKFDGDNAGQVTAIENMVAAGVKGILITPSDSKAIVPAIEKAKAKGVLVIALDTPTEPESAIDALFATDNFKAGELIGEYAKAAMAGKPAKIATLDLAPGRVRSASSGTTASSRASASTRGRPAPSSAPRTPTATRPRARRRWRTASRRSPDINVVYTINEPAALGAYTALKAKGREKDVLIVSVDGGCTGTEAVKDGTIAATSQQYPLKMAAEGVKAVVTYAKDGKKASGYTDTGVTLITDKPQDGVTSKDTAYGLENCWG